MRNDENTTELFCNYYKEWVNVYKKDAIREATWRMTDREKEKISDLKRYQEKYTSIFVIVNLVLSIFMAWLMLVIG